MTDIIIPFMSLFYIQNEEALVTSLRTISSYFLIKKQIVYLQDITLIPLKRGKKLIQFLEDQQSDHHYLEHPRGMRISFEQRQGDAAVWNRIDWYNWVIELERLTELNYPKLNVVLKEYLRELDETFYKSINDMDLLLTTVEGLTTEMIKPYMYLYVSLRETNYKVLRNVNWNQLLNTHVKNCTVIFNQIISSYTKEQILLSIFDIMQTLIEQTPLGSPLQIEDYILFKKEVNYSINKYTSYIDTSKVNFKSWYVCLFNFMQIYCKRISFNMEQSITKLNMIFFLALETDELLNHDVKNATNKDVMYTISKCDDSNNYKYKFLMKKNLSKLATVHPFVRNVYHKDVLFT